MRIWRMFKSPRPIFNVGRLNVAVSPFQLIAIKRNFALGHILKLEFTSQLQKHQHTLNLDNGVAEIQFVVGPCEGHARKDGRTGFSSAAPAALQPLRCRTEFASAAPAALQLLRLPQDKTYCSNRLQPKLH